jgi:hypothetical protein
MTNPVIFILQIREAFNFEDELFERSQETFGYVTLLQVGHYRDA